LSLKLSDSLDKVNEKRKTNLKRVDISENAQNAIRQMVKAIIKIKRQLKEEDVQAILSQGITPPDSLVSKGALKYFNTRIMDTNCERSILPKMQTQEQIEPGLVKEWNGKSIAMLSN
jgi:hypothetical protein